MENIPFGLSIAETDEGYALHRKEPDGLATTIKFSQADLLGIEGAIRTARDRIVPRVQGGSGSVEAVVAYLAVQVRLLPDVLGENIPLTIVTPSQEQISLTPTVAEIVAEEIPSLPAEMKAVRPAPH